MTLHQQILDVLGHKWMSRAMLKRQLAWESGEVHQALGALRDQRAIWRKTEVITLSKWVFYYCLPHDVGDPLIGHRIKGELCRICHREMVP